jgi:integral membrane protein (TIGR01906 family)
MAARQGWRPGPGRVHGAAVFLATILAILALAILPLLTPHFIHPALDAAGSAGRLGVAASVAHRLSDRAVGELVVGPGTFAFEFPAGEPFFDSAERGHLADARLLLWLSLVAGAASLLGIGLSLARAHGERRRGLWRIVSHAGATTVLLVLGLGLISLVAFDSLFTIFHEVFFPGGNWAFDPATQALVQLYPFAFWQVAAAGLGVLLVLLGAATWWLGRRLARSTPALTSEDR